MSGELLTVLAVGGMVLAAGLVALSCFLLAKSQRQRDAAHVRELQSVLSRLEQLTERLAVLSSPAGEPNPVGARTGLTSARQSPRLDGDRAETIARLAHDGLSTVEIAQRVGAGIGEVELVLNLRRADRAGRDAGLDRLDHSNTPTVHSKETA